MNPLCHIGRHRWPDWPKTRWDEPPRAEYACERCGHEIAIRIRETGDALYSWPDPSIAKADDVVEPVA